VAFRWNSRIGLLAGALILTILILATVMAEPLVHPCPTEAEQCGRQCAGQPIADLSWRCVRASCQCPPPIRWPKGLRGH
jgi:hypothetical protein